MRAGEKKALAALEGVSAALARQVFGWQDVVFFHFNETQRYELLHQLKADGLKDRALARKVKAVLDELEPHVSGFILMSRLDAPSARLRRLAQAAETMGETLVSLMREDPEVVSTLAQAYCDLNWNAANAARADLVKGLNQSVPPPLPRVPASDFLISPITALAMNALFLAETVRRITVSARKSKHPLKRPARPQDSTTKLLSVIAGVFKKHLKDFPSRTTLGYLLNIALGAADVKLTPAAFDQRLARFVASIQPSRAHVKGWA